MSADDKATQEPQSNREVLLDMASQLLLAVVVGLVMAVVANAFVEGARWFFNTSQTENLLSMEVVGQRYNLDIFLTLAAAAVLIFLVRRTLGITQWSGPADSIYAVQQNREPLNIRVGMGSTLAAFIAASGGGSVGQYGPLVHFGATMTEVLLKYIRIKIDRRVFIACGVAGAISAGFNAPIAGVLFAHEALLRRISVGAIGPIAVTSILAYAANQAFFSLEPQQPPTQMVSTPWGNKPKGTPQKKRCCVKPIQQKTPVATPGLKSDPQGQRPLRPRIRACPASHQPIHQRHLWP